MQNVLLGDKIVFVRGRHKGKTATVLRIFRSELPHDPTVVLRLHQRDPMTNGMIDTASIRDIEVAGEEIVQRRP